MQKKNRGVLCPMEKYDSKRPKSILYTWIVIVLACPCQPFWRTWTIRAAAFRAELFSEEKLRSVTESYFCLLSPHLCARWSLKQSLKSVVNLEDCSVSLCAVGRGFENTWPLQNQQCTSQHSKRVTSLAEIRSHCVRELTVLPQFLWGWITDKAERSWIGDTLWSLWACNTLEWSLDAHFAPKKRSAKICTLGILRLESVSRMNLCPEFLNMFWRLAFRDLNVDQFDLVSKWRSQHVALETKRQTKIEYRPALNFGAMSVFEEAFLRGTLLLFTSLQPRWGSGIWRYLGKEYSPLLSRVFLFVGLVLRKACWRAWVRRIWHILLFFNIFPSP